MNIIVCVKITPDPADLDTRSDGTISLDRAEWSIGNFDLQAIEAGVRLAEANPGSKVTALTAGPAPAASSKLRKDILSRGPDELVVVVDAALSGADTTFTSDVLASAVQKLGGVDLILCGEGSADLYFQQVGIQLGEKLGLPTLNAISKITLEGEALVVERDLDDELEVLEVPLPAVLSLTTDINPPRLPSMKEILRAAKKTVTEFALTDLDLPGEAASQIESGPMKAPPQVQRKQVMIDGSAQEAAQKLVETLRRNGIL
jgi:electron transfer flavoprotein beta subunit